MILNENQIKIIELTMELDLKTREYKMLCNEFENLKQSGKDPNAKEFCELQAKFEENFNEISEITKQLKELEQH